MGGSEGGVSDQGREGGTDGRTEDGREGVRDRGKGGRVGGRE